MIWTLMSRKMVRVWINPVTNKPKMTQDDPNKYVQTIMEIFRLENVAKEDGSVDCDKVKDKLSRIKAHLKAQNLISQKGRAPNVNLKGLEL